MDSIAQDADSENGVPSEIAEDDEEDFCPVGGKDEEDADEFENSEGEAQTETELEKLRQTYYAAQEGNDGNDDSESGLDSSDDESGESEGTQNVDGVVNADERPSAPDDDQGLRNALLEHLEKYKLFQNCAPEFLQTLLSTATRQCLAPRESLVLKDGGPLFIVETGALRLQVGSQARSQVSVLGRGGILNGAGFLRLYAESQAFRPRRMSFKVTEQPKAKATRGNGYDVQGYQGPPPSIYTDFRKFPMASDNLPGLAGTKLNFFNTCPYACQRDHAFRGTWLSFSARGGEPGEQPAQANTSSLPGGGATVLALPPMQKILDMLSKANGFSFQRKAPFKENCEPVMLLWNDLMSKFCPVVFPGAPVEAVYELAGGAEYVSVPVDGDIITEGEINDDLVLIMDGVATVLKKVQVVDGQDQTETIGRLRAGAIIGDVCLLRTDMPRPATVRAKTDVKTIRLNSKIFLEVMIRFPGMLESCHSRLQEVAVCIWDRLLTRTEVASSLHLFSGCDLGFVNDMARCGERRILFVGNPVVQQGSREGTVFVLEHGRCSVEVASVGKVAELGTGTCFGERTLLGIAAEANATVRVVTPFALVLAIKRTDLQWALEKHPWEQEHFEQMKKSPQAGRISGTKVRHIEMFRGCGSGFLKVLNDSVTTSMYLYGQTIIVEGERFPDPMMHVLTGGIVVAEQGNRPLARMSPGATFGELAMRGQSQEKKVTVRAVTMSFITCIQRSAFEKALEAFPEEKSSFSLENNETEKGSERVSWPCLRGESSRIFYLLDLYAEKASCLAGDRRLSRAPFNEAAILVLQGEVSVLDEQGNEVAVLTKGCCFNERVLVGSRAKQTERLIPITSCEVRVLTRETWGKVMSEFPHELERIRATILSYMGAQAELRLGYEPGSPSLLRASTAFFGSLSKSFAREAHDTAKTRIFEPGMDIVRGEGPPEQLGEILEEQLEEDSPPEGVLSDCLVILLSGTAISKHPVSGREMILKPGSVIGEGVFLGASRQYPHTVTAQTSCMVQVLDRQTIFDALRRHTSADDRDKLMIDRLTDEVEIITAHMNRSRIFYSPSFKDSDARFIRELARCNDIVLFRPGAVIIPQGQECVLGKSEFFMVLAGRVTVEGKVGTVFGTMQRGQIFGEVGAFGLSPYRSATARSLEDGVVCCLRFNGDVITSALEQFPNAREKLSEAWVKMEAKNTAIENERRQWIEGRAVPALAQTPLLAGCPEKILQDLAVQLKEHTFQAGDKIVTAGQNVQWMIVILVGSANVQGKNGECISLLKQGAVFGEINSLGLFPRCMATVRAVSTCRVLIVPHAAMEKATQSPFAKDEGIADAFECLVQSRYKQVARGSPICGLGIDASPDDTRVRAIALLSERMELQPGEVWTPVGDTDPCGPRIGILHAGRAMVQIGPERHIVMQLTPGSIFPEGLAASFGASARAETFCEVYRIRRCDFQMAVGSVETPSNDWLWRFRLQQKNTVEKLRRRLDSVQGLVDLAAPNPMDNKIKVWKDKRQVRVTKAKAMSDARAGNSLSAPQLPPLPEICEQASMTTTRCGSWEELAQLKPGLAAYTVLQLPRLKSKSQCNSRATSKLSDVSTS